MTRSTFFARLLLFMLLSSCSSKLASSFPHDIKAKVIAVIDGDTIEILYDGKPLRIRLAHIDCPEIRKGQPFNKAAKQKASDLCFSQEVQVLSEGEFDRYDRLIAVVINTQKQNVNEEMIKSGLAWHYKKCSNDSTYANLEIKARKIKVGLWADEKPIPPWEWRANKLLKSNAAPATVIKNGKP